MSTNTAEVISTITLLHTLDGVIVGGAEEVVAIAKEAKTLTQQLQSGKLSTADYKELMGDLDSEKLSLLATTELKLQQELQGIFNIIKGVVSFVP